MNETRRLVMAALGVMLLVLMAQIREANRPTRVVTIIVGFPPGQGSDVVARAFGDELTKALGQPFIVENRPGAGATTAAAAVARANANGYTIFLGAAGNLAVAPHLTAT